MFPSLAAAVALTVAGDRPAPVTLGAFDIPAVEVVATRLETDPRKNAARVETLSAEQLDEFSNASTALSEQVSAASGIGALGRDPLTSAPAIRGLARGRSLVLVEGVNISSDRGIGPGVSFLDPALVGRLEVVRGASGVAYGSGAMGGVMSVALGGRGESPGFVRLGGGTNGDERRAVVGVRSGELGGFAAGFVRSRDDYSFPEIEGESFGGRAANSGGDAAGGVATLEREWQGGTLRFAGLGSFTNDLGRGTPLPNRFDTLLEDDHALGSVSFRRNDAGRRLETTLGLHRPRLVNRSERFDGSTGAITRRSDLENESLDASGSVLVERPASRGSWIAGGDVFLRTGVEAAETTTRWSGGAAGVPEAVDLVQGGLQSDAGAFVGWKLPAGDGGQLLLAARGDWSDRSADGQDGVSWVSPSLNASLVVPVRHDVRVSGILARTYRAPQIQELYFEGNRPAGYRLPNPDLEPETAYSLEGGVELHRSSWTASAAVWGMFVEDFIAQLPVDAASDTLRFENVTKGRILGADLAVAWEPRDGTTTELSYAYVQGEDEDGVPLPDIPAGEVTISGRQRIWSSPDVVRSATLRLFCQAGAAKTPIADGTSEAWWSPLLGSGKAGGDEVGHRGYALWNAGLLLRLHGRAAVDLAVTNLFDARQIGRPEPDAFPDPGRSLLLELRLGG
ncbi:MAG: TonB-dependent receptor plug domain-containing protein [Candidatus Eiseniibacteriota bacterium]